MSTQEPIRGISETGSTNALAIGGGDLLAIAQVDLATTVFHLGHETAALLLLDRQVPAAALLACISADDHPVIDKALETLFRTSSPVLARVRFRRGDGAYQTAVVRFRYVLGVISIRTTRLIAEGPQDETAIVAAATAEHEARLALASYAARDTVWELDLLKGEYRFSRRFAESLGHDKPIQKLDMNAFARLLHPEDVTAEERARRRHVAEFARYDIDFRLRDAACGYRWFRAVAETYRDENGRALTMGGTFSDINDTKIAECELRDQRNEMARMSSELQEMSLRLINSQESERRHIARELHDQTGQTLTAAVIDLEFWRGKGVPADEVENVIATVKLALSEIRDISLQLRPPLLDESGLENALRAYLDRQAAAGKFDVLFSAEGHSRRLKPQIEITAFRLVQEALTNIVRHAQARFVDVSIKLSSSDLVIRISDDGSGCVSGKALSNAIGGASLGLISMNERVALVGGRCEFISNPGVGSIVLARIPLD